MRRMGRANFRPHLPFVIACLGLALTIAGTAGADPHSSPWNAAIVSVFRVFSATPELAFQCTGWYVAPAHAGSSALPVSVYITAGHCPTPLLVTTAEGLENTLIIARVHSSEAGADLTIAERVDQRDPRVFLPLATALPRTGERALIVGYGDGHLTTLVVTALPACQRPFVCFGSPVYIRGGLSGSPIVSLSDGAVLGILVASPPRADPAGAFTIIATPASVIRAYLDVTLPVQATAVAGY